MSEIAPHDGFDEWFRAAWPDLTRSLTLAFSGNRELATDAAAEACSVALAKWDQVSGFANPTGWAYTVALRVGRRVQRRARLDRRLRARMSAEARSTAGPDGAWVELADIIGSLPPRQRDVVVLRYVLQMTQRDIADVLGLAPGSVAASLNQARSRLQPLLDADYFDPSPTTRSRPMRDEAVIERMIHEVTHTMAVPPRPQLHDIEQRVTRSSRARRIRLGATAASIACMAIAAIILVRPGTGRQADVNVASVDGPATSTNGTEPADQTLPFPLDASVEIGWLPVGYSLRQDGRSNIPDRPLFIREQEFTRSGLGLDEDIAPILIQVVEAPDVGGPSGDPQPSEVGNGTIYVDGPFSTGGTTPGMTLVEFYVGDDIRVRVAGNQLGVDDAIRIAESITLSAPSCIEGGEVNTSNAACAAADERSSPTDRGELPSTTEAPTTTLPPPLPRVVDGPIEGNVELLDLVRDSIGSWQSVTGTFDGADTAPPLPFQIAADGSYWVQAGGGVEGRTPGGLEYQYQPDQGMLYLTQRTSDLATSPAGSSARLPAESPTRFDTLNLMLAPTYWLRTMVEPNATRVTLLDDRDAVDGRAAMLAKIELGGAVGQAYRDDGWSWSIDVERGILLRYQFFPADPNAPHQGAELRDLVFDQLDTVATPTTEIPAGTKVEAAFVDVTGLPAPVSMTTSRAMSLEDVATDAQRQP